VNDIRLRSSVRLGLFASVLAPVGAALGVWLSHRLKTGNGSVAEISVIAFCCGLIHLFALSLGKKVFPFAQSRNSSTAPPLNAEFLFYLFLSPQNADAIVGDLEERYRFLNKKFGRHRANFWYWFQTFVSLRPIIWAAMKKPLATLAGMAAAKGLIGHDGWIAALIEFVKKVRS